VTVAALRRPGLYRAAVGDGQACVSRFPLVLSDLWWCMTGVRQALVVVQKIGRSGQESRFLRVAGNGNGPAAQPVAEPFLGLITGGPDQTSRSQT
jgi:hypothetical protein